MMFRVMLLFLFSFLLVSCAATKLSTKEMSEIQSGKKGLLQTYNQPLIASLFLGEEPVTQIISVDGQKLASEIFNTDESVALGVGVHRVEFRCASRSGYDERDYSEVMELEIKPFHEYQVRCSFDTDFGPDGTYAGSFSVKETAVK